MSDTDFRGSSDSSGEAESFGAEQQVPDLQRLASAERAEAMEMHLEMLAKVAYDKRKGEAQRRAIKPARNASAASSGSKEELPTRTATPTRRRSRPNGCCCSRGHRRRN